MAEMLIEKPSRINNLSYLLLGYYISSLITYDLNLSFEQKIAFIIALGSFVGTLTYYIKPIERTISLYFRLSRKNKTYPEPPYDEFRIAVCKSEILYSRHLEDERTKINGVFFLAAGILLSSRILETAGLSYLYWVLQVFTVALIGIGFWEVYDLVKRKMPIIVFLYNYYNISEYTPELEKAIKAKDWIKADKIIEKQPELEDPNYYPAYGAGEPRKGLCLKCGEIREDSFCTECGEKILKTCPKCNNDFVRNIDTVCPKYCRSCGTKIARG
jgi:hypothetical protein